MTTKTALVTAAIGLVGAATVSAQVYSVNVVGYVNSTLKPGFNLISNPLNNTATGGNTVGTIFGSALPDGSAVYKFVNGGYEAVNAFSDMFGWDTPGQTLVPGEGVFVFLAGSADVTVTFVGDVNQGALSVPVKAGFNMVSSPVPQAGGLVDPLAFPIQDGDTVYKHQRGGGYALPNSFSDMFGWDNGEPTIEVGEAFWVLSTAAKTWTRTFTVQ